MYEINGHSGGEYPRSRRYTLQAKRLPSAPAYSPYQPTSTNDPYVRELLEREIDFSTYDQRGGRTELLSTNPVPPRVAPRQNFNYRQKPPSTIRYDSDSLPPRSSSQGKSFFRVCFLQTICSD